MVCAVQLELDADALASRFANPPAAATEPRSIAALPFRNLSGDPEQEYFADGLTIEIIAAPRVLSLTRLVGYRIAHQQCLPGYALPLQPTACGQVQPARGASRRKAGSDQRSPFDRGFADTDGRRAEGGGGRSLVLCEMPHLSDIENYRADVLDPNGPGRNVGGT